MSGLFEFTSKSDADFINGARDYYNKTVDEATKAEKSAKSSETYANSAATSNNNASQSAMSAYNSENMSKRYANDSANSAITSSKESGYALDRRNDAEKFAKSAEESKTATESYRNSCADYDKWAATSRDQAAQYAASAEASEKTVVAAVDNAKQSEANTKSDADRAATSATDASNQASKAKDWACKTDGAVDGTEYSAKYWAQQAGGSVAGVSTFNNRSGNVKPVSGDYDISMISGAAPIDSPTFTGTVKAPLPASSSNDTTVPNTQWVQARLSGKASVDSVSTKANIKSPSFSGTPLAPYATGGRNANDNTIANASWVKGLAATDAEIVAGVTNSFFITPKSFSAYSQISALPYSGVPDLSALGSSYIYSVNGWVNGPDEGDYNDVYSYPYGMIKTSLSSSGLLKVQEITTSSTTDKSNSDAVERPHRAIRAKVGKSSYTPWSVLYGSADVKYTPWINISGLNGWSNNSEQGSRSAYRKVFGRVYVEMNLKGGSPYDIIFTLPPGYRPATNVMFPSVSSAFEAVGLYVGTDGGVRFVTGRDVSNIASVFSFDVNPS